MSNKVSIEDQKSNKSTQDKKEELRDKIQLNDLETSKDPKGGTLSRNRD